VFFIVIIQNNKDVFMDGVHYDFNEYGRIKYIIIYEISSAAILDKFIILKISNEQ